jgi:hypothetical protein
MTIVKHITAVILFVSLKAEVCDTTRLEYEILPNCEVRLLKISDQEGKMVSGGKWEEAKNRWLDYLRSNAATDADKNNGVPSSARRIFRSGDADKLYCEFRKDGLISSAYTIPVRWVESKERWITAGKSLFHWLTVSLQIKKSINRR